MYIYIYISPFFLTELVRHGYSFSIKKKKENIYFKLVIFSIMVDSLGVTVESQRRLLDLFIIFKFVISNTRIIHSVIF